MAYNVTEQGNYVDPNPACAIRGKCALPEQINVRRWQKTYECRKQNWCPGWMRPGKNYSR